MNIKPTIFKIPVLTEDDMLALHSFMQDGSQVVAHGLIDMPAVDRTKLMFGLLDQGYADIAYHLMSLPHVLGVMLDPYAYSDGGVEPNYVAQELYNRLMDHPLPDRLPALLTADGAFAAMVAYVGIDQMYKLVHTVNGTAVTDITFHPNVRDVIETSGQVDNAQAEPTMPDIVAILHQIGQGGMSADIAPATDRQTAFQWGVEPLLAKATVDAPVATAPALEQPAMPIMPDEVFAGNNRAQPTTTIHNPASDPIVPDTTAVHVDSDEDDPLAVLDELALQIPDVDLTTLADDEAPATQAPVAQPVLPTLPDEPVLAITPDPSDRMVAQQAAAHDVSPSPEGQGLQIPGLKAKRSWRPRFPRFGKNG